MGELVNPFANPYLPSFANQRPIMNGQPASLPTPQMNYSGVNFGQIHSVKGFSGARAYNLANGASEILADDDPNLARVYIAAKDGNGQMFVKGYDLVPVEEPKPVTMDDLSDTMEKILDRLDKLEAKQNDQPVYVTNSWNGAKQPGNAGVKPNGRNGAGNPEPNSGAQSAGAK